MASKDWKESGLQSTQAQYQSALGEVALDFLQRNQGLFGELPALSNDGAKLLQELLAELARVRKAAPEPGKAFESIKEIQRDAKAQVERAESAQAEAEMEALRMKRKAEKALVEREKYAHEYMREELELHTKLCHVNDTPSIRRVIMWLQNHESYTSWLGLVK